MERKVLYYIQVGKFNESGTGYSDRVSEHFDNLIEARIAYQERISVERKTYKDWHCHKTEHIEVQLVEAIYDVDDDDWLEFVDGETVDVASIDYRGERIC